MNLDTIIDFQESYAKKNGFDRWFSLVLQSSHNEMDAHVTNLLDAYGDFLTYSKPIDNEVGFEDLPTPVGQFIADSSIKGTALADGTYYHYQDVCTLLKGYGLHKAIELKEHVSGKLHDNGFYQASDYLDEIPPLL